MVVVDTRLLPAEMVVELAKPPVEPALLVASPFSCRPEPA